MKKSTIWFLVIIMGVTFAVLLFLQISYMDAVVKMRNEQFDEAVKRSLYRVSKNLEWEEARRFLDDDIREMFDQSMVSDEAVLPNIKNKYKILNPDGSVSDFSLDELTNNLTEPKLWISPKHGNNTIYNTSKNLQEILKNQYLYQRALLDEVVFKILSQASTMPIMQRISVKKLNVFLKGDLQNNGLSLPYRFAIVNSQDEIVYKSYQFSDEDMKDSYTQILFPNDPPSKLNYLKVSFPTKYNYIFSSVRFMAPSFIFTVIMLVVFLYFIMVAFRQKRLTEMKNDFINNMTHEFKTPISTISLAAQMLNEDHVVNNPKMYHHISNVINDETKRLRFQVEKVLQMSMFDRQKTMLKLSDIDLNELVAGVAETFRLKVEKFGGSIETLLYAESSRVMIDEMHFTNVVFNLLDNAVKYAKDGVPPRLVIETRNEGDKLELTITDNGIGVKKDDLKRIFEKFYRVHTGNLHNVKGFGLGLAYVMKIVKDHKGTIRAESEYGVGTKFIIVLPIIKKM